MSTPSLSGDLPTGRAEASPPVVSDAQAAAIARDVFGIEARAIRRLSGERDVNVRVDTPTDERFVLKLLHPGEDPAVSDFQARALLHLAEADPALPAPRVVRPLRDGALNPLCRVGPRRCRVRCVTYLDGHPLERAEGTAAQWRSLGAFLARLDRALAGFRHPADDHELLWDLKRAHRLREVLHAIPDADQRALVASVLDRFADEVRPRLAGLRSQVIHNDINAQNVLLKAPDAERVAGVIDFGDMIRAPLVQEVATACAYRDPGREHPLSAAAHVASGFHATEPLQHEELALLPDLIAGRLALSIAATSWRAAQSPERTTHIMSNRVTVAANLRRLEGLRRDDRVEWFLDRVAQLSEGGS